MPWRRCESVVQSARCSETTARPPRNRKRTSPNAFMPSFLPNPATGMRLAPGILAPSSFVMVGQSSKLRGLNMRNHLGNSFTVWNRRQTWFWLVLNQHGNGGIIGTAATEAEAVRDACCSIEEMSAPLASLSAPPGRRVGNALMPTLSRAYPCSAVALGWMDWWMSLAHLVTDRMLTDWADLFLRSS